MHTSTHARKHARKHARMPAEARPTFSSMYRILSTQVCMCLHASACVRAYAHVWMICACAGVCMRMCTCYVYARVCAHKNVLWRVQHVSMQHLVGAACNHVTFGECRRVSLRRGYASRRTRRHTSHNCVAHARTVLAAYTSYHCSTGLFSSAAA